MRRVLLSTTTTTYQCPGCGTPVSTLEFRKVRTPDDAGYGLLLEDCGHVVTLEAIRDAWGIDVA